MKFLKCMKTALAGSLAFAIVLTAVPADLFAETQGVEPVGEVNPVLHWNMTEAEDGTIKDVTGNGHNGIINGTVEFSEIDNTPVLNLTDGTVTIPDGTISKDATEVTVNMLVKIPENVKSSWMWCIGTSNKSYIYLTGCANQDSKMRGGLCYVPGGNGNGWSFESVIGGSQALDVDQWQNITVTFVEGKDYTFYLNGVKQASVDVTTGAAGECTLQDLMTEGDGFDGYMGDSFYSNDPNFKGAVADFSIYEHAMTEAEVTGLYDGINETLKNLKLSDFGASAIDLKEEECLGTNASKDKITTDLVLPTETTVTVEDVTKKAQITKWTSSNPDAITNEGKVTRLVKNVNVTMTASVTLNDRTVDKKLNFTVTGNPTDEGAVEWDANALEIPNADAIRGNITLPSTGELKSAITWESSNEDVIRTTANGEILPGQVTRQAEDTQVTLTATITYGAVSRKKVFDCTVKKAPKEVETTDYLFAYFPYTDAVKDERIYFGISEDGLNFKALNSSKPVIESTLGTHGLRDPFIIRSHEGDKFYLIATDLTVAGVTQDGVNYPGMGWGENQTNGSQSIMVWESTDLVNWSEQRMCKVAADNAGCTWAPEAYWDDATEQYVVFWASKAGDDGYAKQRLYYATTRDFYTFSDAQVWFEEKGSVIDTTVIKVGEYYYRYTKNEDGNTNLYGTPGKRIYCEKSKSLTAPAEEWTLVSNNSLDVGGGQIEGGCIFKINENDEENAKEIAGLKGYTLDGDNIYCLIADATGSTIFPGLSSNIEDGWFHVLGTTANASVNGKTLYSMPEPSASHGTIMPITSEEYDNLMKKYNQSYVNALNKLVDTAVTLGDVSAVTGDLELPMATTEGNAITWTSSNEAVVSAAGKVTRPAADEVVELTATFAVNGNSTVRAQEACKKTFKVTVKAQEPVVTPLPEDKPSGDTTPTDNNKPAVSYTVNFVTVGSTVASTETVTAGATAAKPADPTRKNYTFSGWYVNGKKYDFTTPVTSDITITAKWAKVTVSKAKLSSVKNSRKAVCTVKAKKTSGAAGYQYLLTTDKKFKKSVKKITTKKTTATFTKLKKGKTYYVKVRAYKYDSANNKVYGSYSSVKKIKIKK